ncbi:hypothetical protein GCM10011608_19610 [Micromonospora sonchi]|uniref:Uncharacterized protein n=1 Tax=Micromonospora sonchi TaxID=1763543 RepID=A0A917TRR7_9ACTN|nr:hypothetical protein [Micromonospora sonchi]GGM35080.1 hypothetical protein GCM10011608_19610 [Micromonospora sonchi]
MSGERVLADMLDQVPWSELDRDSIAAEEVPRLVIDLVGGVSAESRREAADNLYCAAANQGILSEISPFIAKILIQVLRLDMCVDREPVYYVLQAIQECRAWRVRNDAVGERLFTESRAAIDSGLDMYMVDLHRLDLERYPSLLLLFEDLAAKHLDVLTQLWAEVRRSDGERGRRLEETYFGALEHAQQHTLDPAECFCGEEFWLTEKSVADAAPEEGGGLRLPG